MKARIQHKHDIEANWLKATNFIPLASEIIVYDPDENYDYPRIKIGDGKTNINALPFVTKDYAKISDIPTKPADIGAQPAGNYLTSIPSEYITETELSNKGFLTSYTETDPTVPAWAKASSKPSYTKSEVGLGNVDNIKQYSASNPPVVVQLEVPTDTSVLWIDPSDNTMDETPNGGKVDLSITGATAGQTVRIAEVDENGVPTVWEAVDMPVCIPVYTTEDEGAVLRIINGTPTWIGLINGEEGEF